MCCGCPVIAANAASLPEVCADAALYCDPYDPADIAEKIDAVMDNPVLRGQLRTRGIARSGHFSWKACARATWAAIDPARLN
jgi:glycosyltransferase involved in cell wall biosynthesis